MTKHAAVRYEDDFKGWSSKPAAALRRTATSRANLPESIDLMSVAEEIESLGTSQFREFYTCYRVLLTQLLNWQYQPDQRMPCWRTTIRDERDELTKTPARRPRPEAGALQPVHQCRPGDAIPGEG